MSRKKPDISQINLNKIGGRFTYVRLFYGESQEKFAKNIGLSISNVSNIENYKYEPSFGPLKNLIEKYKVNPVWLLTGEGEPYKVVVLEDDKLFLKYDDTPVEGYSEDFVMQLEVIKKEEGKKLDKNPDKTIYNKDEEKELKVEDPLKDLLNKTRLILESKTGYANSLASNIESFYDAIQTKKKLSDHENRLEQIEQKLSTCGEGERDNNIARKMGG